MVLAAKALYLPVKACARLSYGSLAIPVNDSRAAEMAERGEVQLWTKDIVPNF